MNHFAETPGSFGEKQFMLDRDMGLLFDEHPPANHGLGEVIDGEEPQVVGRILLCQDQRDAPPFLWRLLSIPARLLRAIAKWLF
ncbi:hypothetical protein DCAR_0830773 [Daucus carota subsp. sativus]|uniref:Uncharacterized protein n=1 Tax=Daucus carota subsp. sativus TaxID=79200 RepID=A0A175YJW6_DAUCS|nr:hypothetical protein DCAR_0830773 [Daucus carota subsp. sativus]